MTRSSSQTLILALVAIGGLLFGLALFAYVNHQAVTPEAAVVPATSAVQQVAASSGATAVSEPGVSPGNTPDSGESVPFEAPVTSSGVHQNPDGSSAGRVDKPSPPMLAIIVDDLGYGRSGTSTLLELPYKLNLSVLPDLSLTATDYERAVRSGHQVMLHLPMQPTDDSISPGDKAITVGMSDEEIRTTIDGFLEQVPGVRAVNNHMGSRATADESVMRTVIQFLKDREIQWVDSSTTSESMGPSVARSLGMPVIVNNMFLDWEITREYIEGRLLAAAQRARTRGYAVVIGHVSTVFAQTLAEVLPAIVDSGVTLVTIDELVDYLASVDGEAAAPQQTAQSIEDHEAGDPHER